MLGFLFPRLTPAPSRGAALFAAVVRAARAPHWYVAGQVPDTVDGRFRMLASLVALAAARLERLGDTGDAESVALTESFIEAMDAEHREMGLGDPALGRTVRKLVGALGRRVDLWRSAIEGEVEWNDAARRSVYKGEVAPAALGHTAGALAAYWAELERTEIGALAQGRIG